MKTLKEYTWSAYQHALAHLMEPFEAQVRYVGKDVMQNIEIKSIFCDGQFIPYNDKLSTFNSFHPRNSILSYFSLLICVQFVYFCFLHILVNKKCGIVADELVIIFVDGKKYFSYVKAVADPAGKLQ